MNDKKYERKLILDMAFDEALRRFANTEQEEVKQLMEKSRGGFIQESDLTIPTLRLLNSAPEGFLTTSFLIEQLEAIFNPQGRDAEKLEGRNDSHFSQKVRNIISHRTSPNNPIKKGWITYHKEAKGLKITKEGQRVLAEFI